LLHTLPTYMTPDDHEWTNTYPNGSPLIMEHWPDWTKDSPFKAREDRAFGAAAAALTAFQRMQMPYELPRSDRKAYAFDHGCVRVFVIDTRYSRKRDSAFVVNDAVLDRLECWLREPASQSRLNIVASGSVAIPGLVADSDPANPGAVDTWQFAPDQRERLIRHLVDHVPGRFMLLSGDYHLSAAVKLMKDGKVMGAAMVTPPLYAPLPYVNTAPESLDLRQTLLGGRVSLEVARGGEPLAGSGYMRIDVQRQEQGFVVGLERVLDVWESGLQTMSEGTFLLGPAA
jgi:phosphodiesterase/alkaline phosphatase D-like protein